MTTTIITEPDLTAASAIAGSDAALAPGVAPRWRAWMMVAGLMVSMVIIQGIIQAGLPALDKALLADLHISRAALKTREAIFFLASGTSSFIVGLVTRRIGPNVVVFAGLLLMALMLWLYAQAHSIDQIYAIYPFLGLAYASVHVVIVVLLIHRNFATKRALAISVALSGTSIGAAIFPALVVHMLHGETWRQTLAYLAILPLLALPLLVAMLPRNGYAPATRTPPGAVPMAPGPIRRTWPRLLCLIVATSGTFYAATSQLMNLFLYLQDVGLKPQTAATGVSAVFVIGLVGKAIVGVCAERWGSQEVWLVQQVLLLGSAAVLVLGVVPLLPVGLVLLGLGWAGCYVMTQVVISEYFAGPRLGQLIGGFFLIEGASSAVGTWAAAKLFDVFGSYRAGFAVNVAMVLLAVVATLVFRRSVAREAASARG